MGRTKYGLSLRDIRLWASATLFFASATRLAISSVARRLVVGLGAWTGACGGVGFVGAEGKIGFFPVIAAIFAATSARFCLMSSSEES